MSRHAQSKYYPPPTPKVTLLVGESGLPPNSWLLETHESRPMRHPSLAANIQTNRATRVVIDRILCYALRTA